MNAGYYQGAGGMVTQFNRLDVIANNLSNVNTNGYKRDDVVIGDYLRLYQEAKDDLPLNNHTREGAKFLNRTLDRIPQVVEEYTNFSLGSMTKTSNTFDMALKQNDTFFTVLTPNGLRYTRDGSFTLSAEGTLTTKEGFPVIPKAYFTSGQFVNVPQGSEVAITTTGSIQVKVPGAANFEETAELAISTFENMRNMTKEGENLYTTPQPRKDAIGNLVVQGYIEKSNINPINEMIALIETNRMVSMYQKVMDSHMNDLNQDAINKLAAKA